MDLNRDQTTFNGSELKLRLIDEIKRNIIISRHELNLRHWLFSLQDFDIELEGVKKPEERKANEIMIRLLEEKINQFEQSRTKFKHRNIIVPQDIIQGLDKYYKQQIHIYHDSGLEMQLERGALGGFGKG